MNIGKVVRVVTVPKMPRAIPIPVPDWPQRGKEQPIYVPEWPVRVPEKVERPK